MKKISLSCLFQSWPTYNQLHSLAPCYPKKYWSIVQDKHVITLAYKKVPVIDFLPENIAILQLGIYLEHVTPHIFHLIQRQDGFNCKVGDSYLNGKPSDDATHLVQQLKELILGLLIHLKLDTYYPSLTVFLKTSSEGSLTYKGLCSPAQDISPVYPFIATTVLTLSSSTHNLWPINRNAALTINTQISYTEKVLIVSRTQNQLSKILSHS